EPPGQRERPRPAEEAAEQMPLVDRLEELEELPLEAVAEDDQEQLPFVESLEDSEDLRPLKADDEDLLPVIDADDGTDPSGVQGIMPESGDLRNLLEGLEDDEPPRRKK